MWRKYLLHLRYAFRIRKPYLLARLLYTYLGIFLFRKKPLRYIDLAIGYTCNLQCEHCFTSALKKEGRKERREKPVEKKKEGENKTGDSGTFLSRMCRKNVFFFFFVFLA